MDLFLDAHREAPSEIILDLDATDDPLHGHQEGRFFHGYYDGYCYLPLYIFSGEHLLCAKLRRSNIDGAAGAREEIERMVGQIRERWSAVKIILRADSGFCREELMSWCEQNAVDYVFELARNVRLVRAIGAELQEAKAESQHTQRPARRFKELVYRTRKSWARPRRVVAKAEHTGDKANPRFIVTSLSMQQWAARELYEDRYCARGECENRIKEAQLDLFADRLSAATFHPSAAWTLQQLREAVGYEDQYEFLIHDRDNIFASHLDESIRRLGVRVLKSPPHSPKANAICERVIGTIRRECLDWLVPLSEAHLRFTLKSWIAHYNGGRPHTALGPDIPDPPGSTFVHPCPNSRYRRGESYAVRANPILGGLHHEYSLAPACT